MKICRSKVKGKSYKTVVRPAAMNGSECCVLNETGGMKDAVTRTPKPRRTDRIRNKYRRGLEISRENES